MHRTESRQVAPLLGQAELRRLQRGLGGVADFGMTDPPGGGGGRPTPINAEDPATVQ